jgi:2,5-furandicarboxylate decarboxylase 1
MAFLDLRAWIQHLEEKGRLHRVSDVADIRYDVPRMLEEYDGRQSVLFENVGDYFPARVFGGSFGTRVQMAEALGVPLEQLLNYYVDAVEHPIPPVEVPRDEAPVLEVHDSEVRMDRLPAPWHHEKDSGQYITAAIAIAQDPSTGIQNWSIHRLQINDARHLGALILPQHLWHIFSSVERQGRDLPIALALGLPPGYLLASQAVTAFGVDEAGVGGGLFRQPLPMVRSPRNGILVPAFAEYLFEGRILAQQRGPEGPFGEYPRTYGPQSDKPIIEVDEVFHRSDPLFQTILPASNEHMLLGAIPREAAIYTRVRHISPNVRDVALTFASGCRFHVVVSMKPSREGEAKNVLIAGFAGANEVKRVVVVDEDIDISSAEEVEWAIATRVQPHRDIVIIEGAFGSSLDPSAGERGQTSKWGIDATIPFGANRERYERIRTPQRTSS